MEKTRATQVEALREQFQKHGVRKVKLGGFDVDGVLRGKYLSLEKFWGAAEGGLGFCDVIFGWDLGDQLYDNATVTGWHTGYPDVRATVDLATFRMIPWEPGTAAFLLDFEAEPGKPLAVSPRQLLKRVEDKARSMGFLVKVASEYEFFLFRETPESVRAKGYANLSPLSPGMFGYSWLRASENASLVHDLQDSLAAFDIEVEGFHTETGPGVYEAAVRRGDRPGHGRDCTRPAEDLDGLGGDLEALRDPGCVVRAPRASSCARPGRGGRTGRLWCCARWRQSSRCRVL